MKKLVIIGANYLQYPLVKKSNKMGLETHVFAWEKGAVAKDIADYFYPISIVEKEKILNKCKEINPDGITSIASDLAMPTVNYIAEKLGLISNNLDCTQLTTNKYLMREKLLEKNAPIPNFINKSLSEINKKDLNYPLIVKPTDRSGSRGVTKVKKPENLDDAIRRAKKYSFNNRIIIERFIQGKEISVEMVTWKGRHYYLTSTDKVTSGFPYFVEIEQHQPANLSRKIKRQAVKITKRALSALGVKYGASHTEIKIDKNDRLFIIEVGARMGGDFIGSHLVKLSTGYDFLESVINISLGDFIEPNITNKGYSGICYLNPEPGIVKDIKDNTLNNKNAKIKKINYKIGEKLCAIKESSDRKGYFIYQSKTSKLDNQDGNIIKIITKSGNDNENSI